MQFNVVRTTIEIIEEILEHIEPQVLPDNITLNDALDAYNNLATNIKRAKERLEMHKPPEKGVRIRTTNPEGSPAKGQDTHIWIDGVKVTNATKLAIIVGGRKERVRVLLELTGDNLDIEGDATVTKTTGEAIDTQVSAMTRKDKLKLFRYEFVDANEQSTFYVAAHSADEISQLLDWGDIVGSAAVAGETTAAEVQEHDVKHLAVDVGYNEDGEPEHVALWSHFLSAKEPSLLWDSNEDIDNSKAF